MKHAAKKSVKSVRTAGKPAKKNGSKWEEISRKEFDRGNAELIHLRSKELDKEITKLNLNPDSTNPYIQFRYTFSRAQLEVIVEKLATVKKFLALE